jgi:hypothetical protein
LKRTQTEQHETKVMSVKEPAKGRRKEKEGIAG